MIARDQLLAALEAERARSALLSASLKQAEAEVAALAQALKRIIDADDAQELDDADIDAGRAALTAVGVL